MGCSVQLRSVPDGMKLSSTVITKPFDTMILCFHEMLASAFGFGWVIGAFPPTILVPRGLTTVFVPVKGAYHM